MFLSNQFSPNEIAKLQLVYSQKTYRRREFLPLKPNCIWKIEQGILRTITRSQEDEITTLGFWSEGDIVGQPLSTLEFYQIECLTDVSISQISLDSPSLKQEALIAHILKNEKLHAITNQNKAINRLLSLLGWLAERFGQNTSEGIYLKLYLTHQDIAETINTNRVRVTRLLSELEQKKKIKRSGRNIILLT